MPVKTQVVYADSSWRGFGTQYSNVPFTEVRKQTYVRATKTTDSRSSPLFWRKTTKMVAFVPRSGRIPSPPLLPRRPPLPRYPRFDERRPKQTLRSWRKALAKREVKLRVYNLRVQRNAERYVVAMEKYRVRLAKYQAFANKVKNGVPRKVRVQNRGIESVWNPFTTSNVFDTGALGTSVHPWVFWEFGNPISGEYGYSGDLTDIYDLYANGGWPTDSLNDLLSNATTAADSQALNRFHDKLSGEQVHIGQIIAERAQAISLLADTATRLANFLRNFTPKRAISALLDTSFKSRSKTAANDYLAFKFGAEPLVNDVKGAAEALAHLIEDKLNLVTVKASGSSTRRESLSGSFIRNGITYVYTHNVEVFVRYVCEYGTDNVLTREMSKLGLINSAEILWELAPWSFLVDWLYPIGTYIRHLTNDVGLTYRRGTRSVRTVVTTRVTVAHNQELVRVPKYWGSDEGHRLNWSRTRGSVSKVRTLLDEPPKVQAPQLRNPFSFTHLMESLALLRQKTFK
jgi:hypothetical protein